MNKIELYWSQIVVWYKLNSGQSEFMMPTGATEGELADVYAALGVALPEDVTMSYKLYNGSGGEGIFLNGYEFLSLSRLLKYWRGWARHVQHPDFDPLPPSSPLGPIKRDQWNAGWIPLARNGSGDLYCSDLSPATGGTIGQIIKYSHEEGPLRVVGTSFLGWLADYSNGLVDGRFVWSEDDECVVAASEL